MTKIDVNEKRFGFLFTTNITESKNGRIYIKCLCDCGNEKYNQNKTNFVRV